MNRRKEYLSIIKKTFFNFIVPKVIERFLSKLKKPQLLLTTRFSTIRLFSTNQIKTRLLSLYKQAT